MKALVGAFNQEKALVGAFSVIVHCTTVCGTDGSFYSTSREVTDKTNFQLVKSTMTRATETGNIILGHLPEDISASSCDLLREGAPCPPDPPASEWTPEPCQVRKLLHKTFFLLQ